MRPLLNILILLLFTCSIHVLADDTHQAKLNELKKDIIAVQQKIASDRAHSSKLKQQLASDELKISTLNKNIAFLKKKIKQSKENLTTLNTQAKKEQVALSKSQQQLNFVIQEIWKQRNRNEISILLEQDPNDIARVEHYTSVITQRQQKTISDYRSKLTLHHKTIDDRNLSLKKLNTEKALLNHRKNKLQAANKQRISTRIALNSQLKVDTNKLAQQTSDQKKLERLIKDVTIALNGIKIPTSSGPFRKVKGKLPPPINSKVIQRYGQRREGNLRWEGYLYNAKPGQVVRSVHSGRVVYADWLSGLGLLIAIDHGDDYLTIYGHNQTLLVDIGDWVNSGQEIAQAGNTGNSIKPNLYFEIRHKEKPLNPKYWIRK